MNESHQQPHRGVLILILGILGFLVCVIAGVIAWVMGNADLAAMREGRMDREGEGLTQAGRIIGIVAVVLNVIGILIFVVMLALGLTLGVASNSM